MGGQPRRHSRRPRGWIKKLPLNARILSPSRWPVRNLALVLSMLAMGAAGAAVGAFWLAASNSNRAAASVSPAASKALFGTIGYMADPTVGFEASPAGLSRSPRPVPPLRIEVARGDTLMRLLVKADVPRKEAHAAVTALRQVYDPRDLKIGQEVFLRVRPASAAAEADGPRKLVSLALRPSLAQDILVERTDANGFEARALARPLESVLNVARGSIDYSLALAAGDAGVPANILLEAIRALSFDVDFQRDLQAGDDFELFYETFEDEDGRLAKTGRLLYGALTLSGSRLEIYRHELADGDVDYFDAKGQSVRKALLLTPIDGARISSGYGKRKHPILGYTKMHRGVDFSAPRGTPIYAAGKGKVEVAGRKGGYGKYVRIRHNSEYKTAYAHLSRFAKGITAGKRVTQGQIIGYVGSTGRSTGPHLHYEVHRSGRQVNPRKVKLPAGIKLTGEALEHFQAARAELDRRRAAAEVRQVVQAD